MQAIQSRRRACAKGPQAIPAGAAARGRLGQAYAEGHGTGLQRARNVDAGFLPVAVWGNLQDSRPKCVLIGCESWDTTRLATGAWLPGFIGCFRWGGHEFLTSAARLASVLNQERTSDAQGRAKDIDYGTPLTRIHRLAGQHPAKAAEGLREYCPSSGPQQPCVTEGAKARNLGVTLWNGSVSVGVVSGWSDLLGSSALGTGVAQGAVLLRPNPRPSQRPDTQHVSLG